MNVQLSYTYRTNLESNNFNNHPEIHSFTKEHRTKVLVDRTASINLDTSTRIVKCTLYPGEALLIGEQANLTLSNTGDHEWLKSNLKHLIINKYGASEVLDSGKVVPRFQQHSMGVIGLDVVPDSQ